MGKEDATDIPISLLQPKMEEICDQLKGVASSLEYNIFRLGIFTNIVNPCHLRKSGVHLRPMVVHAKGAAAWNHLMNPTSDSLEYDKLISMTGEKWFEGYFEGSSTKHNAKIMIKE